MRRSAAACRVGLGVLALWAAPAGGEEEPAPLPEVVVTGTRTPLAEDESPSTVSVVSGEEIELRDQTVVSESLRTVPGVDVTEFGAAGRTAFASIRGAAPDQVLVLLDGVEVNTPTVGQFDFADLTTDLLDRIEVLRGGGGALYGSAAIGGVINAITRRGEGPLRVTASGEAGNGPTHREVLRAQGANGPLAAAGAVSFLDTDGFRSVNDGYRNLSTTWRADADVLPAGTLRGFLRYTGARAGLPDFNVVERRIDPDARSRTEFLLAKGEWEQRLLPALTGRLALSHVRDHRRFRDDEVEADCEVEPVVRGGFRNEISALDGQLDHRWRGFALTTAGVEVKERTAEVFREEVEEEEEGREIEREGFRANRTNFAFYAQEQVTLLSEALRAVGGVRFDRYDGFGERLTWSGSAVYALRRSGTRLRVGYAEGFRAPTFDELFEPTLGNPGLRPETSWEIDAGVTQDVAGGRARVGATYFHREVQNLIEEVADLIPGPIAGVGEDREQVPVARNLDARFHGIELTARASLARWLSVAAGYTYLDFSTPTGRLLNRPRHRGSFTATGLRTDVLCAGDEAAASLIVIAVGRRDSANPFDPDTPFAPRSLSGYARVDLALSYRLGGALAPLTLTASVRNLLDRDYQESIGFPAPPARFLAGLRWEF